MSPNKYTQQTNELFGICGGVKQPHDLACNLNTVISQHKGLQQTHPTLPNSVNALANLWCFCTLLQVAFTTTSTLNTTSPKLHPMLPHLWNALPHRNHTCMLHCNYARSCERANPRTAHACPTCRRTGHGYECMGRVSRPQAPKKWTYHKKYTGLVLNGSLWLGFGFVVCFAFVDDFHRGRRWGRGHRHLHHGRPQQLILVLEPFSELF